jgi:hypothetical protein
VGKGDIEGETMKIIKNKRYYQVVEYVRVLKLLEKSNYRIVDCSQGVLQIQIRTKSNQPLIKIRGLSFGKATRKD